MDLVDYTWKHWLAFKGYSPFLIGIEGVNSISRELCNRTYFEDISGANIVKKTDRTFVPPDSSAKKSKSSFTVENSCCQVEGCNVDLSSAKSYHRKHRVCESHSKSPRVVINGHERRFCQQCSRFHSLLEFDQKKRSCRARLSDHNARRRKQKSEIMQFNSMRLASSSYEGRNQLNFGFNQVAAKAGVYNPIKGDINSLHCTKSCLPNPETKVSPVEVDQPGLSASKMKAAQELRALSLLSTISSWDSSNYPQPMHPTIPGLSQPPFPAVAPNISPEFWAQGSQTQSFQLFKAPRESGFYLY